LHTEYAPFAYLSMDIKTMYPSRSGHSAILVCVDEQTHFMVCYPLKKGDSSIEIAEILTQELFHTYGQPKEITTDMDPKFKNKLLEHVFQSLKVKLNFVNPYNHNALKVERHIRTLQEQLICHLKQKADLWPNYLTGVAAAHNNTVSVNLGHSPFYLLYMRHPPSPDSFNLEPIQGPSPTVEQYVETLRARQNFLRNHIIKLQEISQEKQALESSRRATTSKFEEGDLVYMLHPTGSDLQTPNRKIILK
jgi:hypothetical protein